MKLPYSWLKEHVAVDAPAEALADDLIRLGHEVEGIECPRRAVSGVRVGRILEMNPHPNADRLKLLKVDVGGERPLAIVCGATNMKPGDRVPVATIGTRLPNGMTIRKGKIRGETSEGMCCSEAELGLAEDADGLMILPEDAPVGLEVGEYLGLEEAVFDLSITPNRGDCMSVRGIAREIAADRGLELTALDERPAPADTSVSVPEVALEAAEDCPLYLARRIEGLTLGPAPEWIRRRLVLAGQRPVNGVVDILNYLMLELGQPMHAFDAEAIRGTIRIRAASDGERFAALDGRSHRLNAGDLVIADDASVLALAGIMGSEESGVKDGTTSIVLESAFFRPARISLTRRAHAIVSEASMRFERGVDPDLVHRAMERATELILEHFGGKAGAVARAGRADAGIEPRRIDCEAARIESRLGLKLTEKADRVLEAMGFSVRRDAGRLSIEVPRFRHDIERWEDISEEYARIIGFDAIEAEDPKPVALPPRRSEAAVCDAVRSGAVQVITYAFIGEGQQRLFVPDDGRDLRLSNPISEQMAVMRRSLFPGLLAAARHNLNRQASGVSLVEQGRIYQAGREGPEEIEVLAWLMAGNAHDDEWYAPARPVDFFDLKGAVERWLAARRISARFVADDNLRGLQPGQSARIVAGKREGGVIGRISTKVARAFEIEAPAFVASIRLDAVGAGRPPRFAPLPEHPASQRDLVFLIDRGIESEAVVRAAARAAGSLAVQVRVFDRYSGQGIPEGKLSLGLRLVLQAPDRTLAQQEVDAVAERVVAEIGKRFGATLRA